MKKENLINRLKLQKFPEKIIRAFENVDRSFFVPIELSERAYEDISLPIGYGQTISQPYTIAFMLSLLDVRDGQKILEVGSGSGYVLALLAELNKGGEIVGVERIREFAYSSKEKLGSYKNVKVIHGNVLNIDENGFDRILSSASFQDFPQKIIHRMLKMNGVFVGPVGTKIISIKKEQGENKVSEFPGFSFVPIIDED